MLIRIVSNRNFVLTNDISNKIIPAKNHMQIITTHNNADFDSLASMLAAQKLYPEAKLVFAGSQEENLRQFLAISAHKINYYKVKQINIEKITRLILVDTRQAERIGSLSKALDRPDLEIIIYDHHPPTPNDLHGRIENIQEVGATTTILVHILKERKLKVTPAEATVFALGIYEDTGLLTYNSTTPADLMAAAHVRAWGADLNAINTFINRDMSAQQIFTLGELIQNAETYLINEIEVVISCISMEKYHGDLAILAHKLRDIEKIDALFMLVRLEARVHLIARSNLEQVNVGEIAMELGGGGHPTAASATIKELSLSQTKDKLLDILKEHISSSYTVADIMTTPAKSLTASASILEAKERFTRYGINHLPVVNDNMCVLGIISRQTVDKAIAHNMNDSLVAECMVSDISWLSPDTDLLSARKLIMQRHQPLLPVVEDKRLQGVITRSDLLRMMHEYMAHHPQLVYPKRDIQTYKKNLTALIRERLPDKVQNILKLVGQVGDEAGYAVYVVGGMVRDLLLRMDNLDMDIVAEQDGIEFARILAERVGGRYKAHAKFATAVLIFPDGFKIDVATARTEYYEHPGALPIVEQSSIKQDLYRRDFSINSLAIQLNQKHFGRLIDFFGGQQDIKNKVIRVLHSLSFVEDPSRVFRAIRFEQRFDFRIGKYTMDLIQHSKQRRLCDRLAGGRLMQELVMIFEEKNPAKAIIRMGKLELLHFIHPAIKANKRLIQLSGNIHMIIQWYNLLFLKHKIEKWLLYLLTICDQLNDKQAGQVYKRLNLGVRHIRLLNDVRAQTPKIMNRLYRFNDKAPSKIFRLLKGSRQEALLYAMAKTGSNQIKQTISFYITKLQHETPQIGGAELIELGFKPGPTFRRILDVVQNAKLDGRLKGRDAELDFVKKTFHLD